MNRGFLRMLVLNKLSEAELTGSQLMQAIEKEGPFHKPSPGSIYPLLTQLTEEKLIARLDEGKGKRYSITLKGKKELAKMINWGTEAFSTATSIFAGDIASEQELMIIRRKIEKKAPCKGKDRGIKAWNSLRRSLIEFLVIGHPDDPEAEEIYRIMDEARERIESVNRHLKK